MSIIKEKLTDKQLRIVQLIAGIFSGICLSVTLYLSNLQNSENIILQYLWLIIFVIIMFGRRWIERKFRLRLLLYNLVLVNTLVICIVIYLSVIFYSPGFADPNMFVGWSETLKLAIVVVPAIAILVLGIFMPLKRYFKRKEDGKLRFIRLPEPKDEDETEDTTEDSGPMTIEQQIAAMTKDLDSDKKDSDEK